MLGEYVPILHQHLLKHGGMVLFDGLDEVPEAGRYRTQIKHVVEDFAATFHRCRIVVTSRTYAYQQQDWRLNGFRETVLAPFTESQIHFFVDHWYQTLAEHRGMDRESAQGRAELLKRAIKNSDNLSEFAERPLLLTLMASLHAWRGGSLPEKRGELYAEATDLLLDWWERAKMVPDREGNLAIERPSLTEMLRVGKDRVQDVLNELAFESHQGQTQLVGTADIPEEHIWKNYTELRNGTNVEERPYSINKCFRLFVRTTRIAFTKDWTCTAKRSFQSFVNAILVVSHSFFSDAMNHSRTSHYC